MMKKLLSATSGTDRNRGPTAFPSVSVYLTMMKNIIANHFWYGQERELYSVSICEHLCNSKEKYYSQPLLPLLVRTGTGAIQRFHCERLSNNDEKIIVSHFWCGEEQEPYSVSICERLSNNDEKHYSQPFLPFWYGQEQGPYSVSICERLSNNDEKHYCQPLLVRTGTGALQRFHLRASRRKSLLSAISGTDRNRKICERLSNNDEKIIVSHFWYGQEQGPYSVSICERYPTMMKKKLLTATSGTHRNRSPTAFNSVRAYLKMMKNIIVSHFWYGQEKGPNSVSICERLSNNDEKKLL
ncbi:hypothetical protein CDAR_477681 [Caerostris darwini]|uniref:Uncharacterized protein n=1 Tax=Caerostris darwini TaxID=1538125 RepID=A0AAV4MDG2_9ARAC|nr:hypothetical protein CDAR_477681 [Caerostris darwini]